MTKLATITIFLAALAVAYLPARGAFEWGAAATVGIAPCDAIDGDSVRCGDKRLRLRGIDAFELKQAWGPAARDVLQRLLERPGARCKVVGAPDRYGRPLADCCSDGAHVQTVLVEEGLALWYRRYSDDGVLMLAEARAEAGMLGAWSGSFRAPCEFRRLGTAAPLRDRSTLHLASCLH